MKNMISRASNSSIAASSRTGRSRVIVAAAMFCWVLLPFGGLAEAGLLEESLPTGPSLPSDPALPGDPLPPLPVDPLQEITDIVDPILNPPQDPPPGEESSGGGSDSESNGSTSNDGTTSDAETTSSSTTSHQNATTLPPSQAPMQGSSASAESPSTVGAPTGQASYSYRPAATRFVSLGDAGLASYRPSYGSRSTSSVLQLLKKVNASPRTVARILAPFPVAGPASYSDDWGAPRYTPSFHLHEGTDIFAELGTPVIASSDGVVTHLTVNASIGGTSLKLTMRDGTYFYYGHLDRFAPKLTEGARVAEGDVIGFVGKTGNAEGGLPHLHFEIHPKGAAAVPPVPYLDRWLGEALQAARALKASPSGARAFLGQVPSRMGAAASQLAGAAVRSMRPDATTPLNLALWGAILGTPGLVWLTRRRRAARASAPPDLLAAWMADA